MCEQFVLVFPSSSCVCVCVCLSLCRSAKILIYFSPAWSVLVSLWANIALACVFAVWMTRGGYCILSRWVYIPVAIVELWTVFAGVAAAAVLYRCVSFMCVH